MIERAWLRQCGSVVSLRNCYKGFWFQTTPSKMRCLVSTTSRSLTNPRPALPLRVRWIIQYPYAQRTVESGLVQHIFSSPSRRSPLCLPPVFRAPRRWAKNALRYFCVSRVKLSVILAFDRRAVMTPRTIPGAAPNRYIGRLVLRRQGGTGTAPRRGLPFQQACPNSVDAKRRTPRHTASYAGWPCNAPHVARILFGRRASGGVLALL